MTTPFQEMVYKRLREVPRGKVTTYKHLARAVGCGSSQAVGQALKRNPYAPHTPCHRVITTSGTIGGFNGHRTGQEIQRKQILLEQEGVRINQGKVVGFAERCHEF